MLFGACFRKLVRWSCRFASYLVNSPEEWKETILKLAKDPELRKRLGQEAAKTVEDTYSVHANEPIYLGVLDGVFRS